MRKSAPCDDPNLGASCVGTRARAGQPNHFEGFTNQDDMDTLIYLPTNNCARVMSFVKLNELEDVLTVKSPADYGGLKSPEYLKINPMAKMPAFITAEGTTLYESQVILEHLADKYSSRLKEPCIPSTLEARTKMRLLIRVMDIYMSGANCTQDGFFSSQGVMYKTAMAMSERKERTIDFEKQLDVIEGLLDDTGPFAAGAEISYADCSLHPTYVFIAELAPASLGWADPFASRPKTARWYAHIEAHPILGKAVGTDVHGFCQMNLAANATKIGEELQASK